MMALDLEFALMMRAMAARGLDDQTFLHCSMRTDALARKHQFLINVAEPRPFWATRSDDSCCVDADGLADNPQKRPNAQFWIHRDIYAARPDWRCILHVHTPETVACAALGGFRQTHQGAALFTDSFVGIMPYRGLNRYDGLVDAFGLMKFVVLMQGHGAMVGGRTPGEAFEILVNLQDACVKELTIPKGIAPYGPTLVDVTHQEWVRGGRPFGRHSWPAERDAIYEEALRRGEVL